MIHAARATQAMIENRMPTRRRREMYRPSMGSGQSMAASV